ncbi:MAG: hypothetical protein ACXAC2_00100 [Candidatus Kariarchaeaceae archaeon]|jgi:hypothetical protein
MSTEVFDLGAWYRDEVPRGQPDLGSRVRWETTNLPALTITADGATPSIAIFIKELRIRDQAFTPIENVAGNGLITITYPDEDGNADVSKTINYMEELAELAKEILTENSQSIYVISFDPAIKLFTTKDKDTFTVDNHANLTGITSGELDISAKGWRLEEANY